MVYCVESKETFDNCISEWAPEVAHFCPNAPVGALHCNRSDFDNPDRPTSPRCISEEEGKKAAKRMGKCCTCVVQMVTNTNTVYGA